jgi:chromosome segregation protein
MTELEAEVRSLEDAVSEAMDRKRECTSLIAQWEEELVRLRGEVHRMEIQINSRRKDLERYEDESRRIDQRLRVLGFERERLQPEEQELARQTQEVQAEVVSWEAREKSMSDEMAGIQARWDGIRADLEERESLLTNRKVGMAALQQRREANERTLERLNRSLDQTLRDLEAQAAGIETAVGNWPNMPPDRGGQSRPDGILREMETLVRISVPGGRSTGNRKRSCGAWRSQCGVLKGQLEEAARETGNCDLACREIAFQVESLKQSLQARDQDEVPACSNRSGRWKRMPSGNSRKRWSGNRRTLDGFGEVNFWPD